MQLPRYSTSEHSDYHQSAGWQVVPYLLLICTFLLVTYDFLDVFVVADWYSSELIILLKSIVIIWILTLALPLLYVAYELPPAQ